MQRERLNGLEAVTLAVALILVCLPASAQLRIVGSISGTVQDSTGAAVPGAKVVLKDEGTGVFRESTATGEGTFYFPDLAHGLFEVTVSAPGFQNAVVAHIIVEASKTTDVAVMLRVGQQTESVTVEGVAPVLETSSPLVATTQTTKLVNELPTGGRASGLEFARLVPGINNFTSNTVRVNNVAGGAVNVTVDGINDASNGFKSGGTVWYNTVPVRLGALEEVTVETGGMGADSGAESGVNIKFITRRGASSYHGSGFYQPYSEQFNANSWSRNAIGLGFRTYSRRHEFGGNIGGPLVPAVQSKIAAWSAPASIGADSKPSPAASRSASINASPPPQCAGRCSSLTITVAGSRRPASTSMSSQLSSPMTAFGACSASRPARVAGAKPW